ncbi:PadR family transcriptional regulator [Saccharothrix variisporea]|uniref:DNA-binding PadR family transcriptional regulator n=1 Tax=Saccharothrix variisporea TaxID=543527 RepID=A0A495X3B0_9PSEU|nr:PadR family transcriptional regulator [Saccharothrix variisporea]RKT68006.1 DNA-binding PadR family transcriptional regulator [Saccharothrix variisporea]
MARYRRANPLALAVLGLLQERSMHPYEMATTLRQRHKEDSIKLNYGSLYTVVESLEKHGFVEALEARREGRRPERTVYGLTAEGRAELHDWLRELIGTPVKEYPRFEAGLSLVGLLAPGAVAELLRGRVSALDAQAVALRETVSWLRGQGLPELTWVELDYRVAMLDAERAWVRRFAASVEEGAVGGMEAWRAWHENGAEPGGLGPG